MDKFILVSLLLVVFSVDCFGFKCYVCTKGEGEEYLCGPGEKGEEVDCPAERNGCKHIWIKLPGMDRKDYRGCDDDSNPSGLTNVRLPHRGSCRIEDLDNGGLKQECYCGNILTTCNDFYDLPRLKCHFCKDSTSVTTISPCPHGAETVVKECTLRNKPSCTTIFSRESGERLSLGCERSFEEIRPYIQCRELGPNKPGNPVAEDVYACQCDTDSCNFYTEKVKDFRTCNVCTRGRYRPGGLNKCALDEATEAEVLCPPDFKYCYTTFTSLPGRVKDEITYYRGCAKLPVEDDAKFSKVPEVKWPKPAAGVSCRFHLENGVLTQECHCSSDSCNVEFKDIPDFKICYVCGGKDNLCAAGEEGEAQLCPNDMEYCYNTWTWTGRPGEERKYYKGCAKLPAEEDEFKYVYNSLCRIVILEQDAIRQECFCSRSVCNRKGDYVGDIDNFRCLVCKGEDNLCAPGEEGEVQVCPWRFNYCKTNWKSEPDKERKYYKGCAQLPPAGNNEFTVKDSVSCRIEQPDEGFINQECYCTPDNCNRNSFADLPIPDPSLKCIVCHSFENYCDAGKDGGEESRCPRGKKYCKNIWTEFSGGPSRLYYKGCANTLPSTGNNKFIEKDANLCRVEDLGSGKIGQECYCPSNNCNSKNIDDLPNFSWCYMCSGADNLCTSIVDGEVKLCPTDMKYCHTTWTSPLGEYDYYNDNRKYYKGCAKELPPAGNNKFTEVDNSTSASCRRVDLLDKDVTSQECYCTTNACNEEFEDLPEDENDLYCLVCTGGGGRDNLCASDEDGNSKQCPPGMKYCYSTWVDHPGSGLDRVYYRGCVKQLPTEEKDKFKVEDSASCRIRIPEKGKVTQECYCQSDSCNGYFKDLPIPKSPEVIFETKCNPSIGVDNTFASVITIPVILLHIILV